jgi:hypothetical protein
MAGVAHTRKWFFVAYLVVPEDIVGVIKHIFALPEGVFMAAGEVNNTQHAGVVVLGKSTLE